MQHRRGTTTATAAMMLEGECWNASGQRHFVVRGHGDLTVCGMLQNSKPAMPEARKGKEQTGSSYPPRSVQPKVTRPTYPGAPLIQTLPMLRIENVKGGGIDVKQDLVADLYFRRCWKGCDKALFTDRRGDDKLGARELHDVTSGLQ